MSESQSAAGAWHRPMVARLSSEKHRAATALELFFDLCFVTAVAQASGAFEHELAEGRIAHGILGYAMVFFAIWWAWANVSTPYLGASDQRGRTQKGPAHAPRGNNARAGPSHPAARV